MTEKTITPAEYAKGYEVNGQHKEYIVVNVLGNGNMVVLVPDPPDTKKETP